MLKIDECRNIYLLTDISPRELSKIKSLHSGDKLIYENLMNGHTDEPSEKQDQLTNNKHDSTTNEIENHVVRPLTQEDKQIIESANEILNSLEHVHRTDLTLHLYSSFLLKKLILKANEKEYLQETTQFIKSEIKDSWVSWPNPTTIIDPKTDKIYEDIDLINDNKQIKNEVMVISPNEVSSNALAHAKNMLNLEFSSHWQHLLSVSSKKANISLDIDNTDIPKDITNTIFNKLDHFFSGLHHKVAKQNKITVSKSKQTTPLNEESQTTVEIEKGSTNINKKIRLSYRDIIERACQMSENTDELYVKSLELFNDIPNTFDKHSFKLPKKVLKKYRYSRPAQSSESLLALYSNAGPQFVSLKNIAANDRIPKEQREILQDLNKKQTEMALNRKTFYEVQGFKTDNERLIEDFISKKQDILIPKKKREKSLVNRALEPDTGDYDAYDMDDYMVDMDRLQ